LHAIRVRSRDGCQRPALGVRLLVLCVAVGFLCFALPESALADGFCFPIGDGLGIPTTSLGFGQSWSTYYGHLGEDYAYGDGTRVNAGYAGRVVYRYFGGSDAYNGGWGNTVVLEHTSSDLPGGRVYTQYSHLSAVSVAMGQVVATGQKVGEVGSSGFGTGSHLHFEIKSGSDLGHGYAGSTFSSNTRVASGMTYYKPRWFIENHRDIGNAPYPSTLTVTRYGSGTEAVNKFSLSVKNNTASAITLERLKVDLHLTQAGRVGGTKTDFDIMGESNVVLAAGATLSRTWYRALPRDGDYTGSVSIKVAGAWLGDDKLSAARHKNFTVAYAPKGDFEADGDSDFTAVYATASDTTEYLYFDSFLGNASSGSWSHSREFSYTRNGVFGYLDNGKYVKGNFNLDGKADLCAIFDDLDGTCTMRVYGSDGTAYVGAQWFQTGGWRLSASTPVAMDVNADGDDDLVIIYDTSGPSGYGVAAHVFSAVGDRFTYGGVWGRLTSTTYDYYRRARYSSGDINGDGLDELIVLTDAGGGQVTLTAYSLSSTGQLVQLFTRNAPFDYGQCRLLAGDIDRDGCEDAVLITRQRAAAGTSGIGFVAMRSTGSAWSAPSYFLDSAGPQHYDNGKFVCADFTSDGRADIAAFYDDGDSTSTLKLYASTGSTFAYPGGWLFQTGTYRWHRTRPVDRTQILRGAPIASSIAGTDRYDTAIKASQAAFTTAPCVVIATGTNWPDALGGAALASAEGGPILLTDPRSLTPAVLTEIRRLGASRACVLGGTGAVSVQVEQALKTALGSANVTRLGGTSRYETANLAARATVAKLGAAYDGTCFVATGANFPDALAASPLSAAKKWPILLSEPGGLPWGTRQAIADIGVRKAIVLGQSAAVPVAVQTYLEGVCGVSNVTRLAGGNRYQTAATIAEYGCGTAGLHWNGVALTSGETFPDALSGGVLQGRAGTVMLLTPARVLSPDTAACLQRRSELIGSVRFLGGTGALSESVRAATMSALE